VGRWNIGQEWSEPAGESALLVGAQLKDQIGGWDIQDSLAELGQLARTAGVEVAGQTWQRLNRFEPATLIGSGKVAEVVELRQDLDCSLVIFDDELSARQLRNLEKAFGDNIKVLDRTGLILDIFAQHARTREGQLQVELAQYQYRLPRLTRPGHTWHAAGGGTARGGTGGVGLRGPGETQLEVDRREISRRIAKIKDELEQVRRHRQLHRRQRSRAAVPVVANVGYTNAGKSTLLNALSGADVLAEPVVHAESTSGDLLAAGRFCFRTGRFLQKLPDLSAFRATLEINEADLIVRGRHHPSSTCSGPWPKRCCAGVVDRPVLMANKTDRLLDPAAVGALAGELDSLPSPPRWGPAWKPAGPGGTGAGVGLGLRLGARAAGDRLGLFLGTVWTAHETRGRSWKGVLPPPAWRHSSDKC
jgi:GTP-binding protein HflX